MIDTIAKIITGVVLLIIILASFILYKKMRKINASAYLYVTATVSILCAFAYISFDKTIFLVSHDYIFYYTELGIYLGIIALGNIIVLIVKKVLQNKKDSVDK